MAKARQGDEVKVHYKGHLGDGSVFDSSEGREPLQFKIGEGLIIPGFEQAVVGMEKGENKTVLIPAAEAYGAYQEEMVAVVERDQFPVDLNPEIGQQLELGREEGQNMIVTVTEVTEKTVTLDANHPLAGEDLTFEIDLVEIV
jgi:peptidylprolyl isomerase